MWDVSAWGGRKEGKRKGRTKEENLAFSFIFLIVFFNLFVNTVAPRFLFTVCLGGAVPHDDE